MKKDTFRIIAGLLELYTMYNAVKYYMVSEEKFCAFTLFCFCISIIHLVSEIPNKGE